MAEHYLDAGDYVIADGFHFPHKIDTVMAIAKRKGEDPNLALERQLNRFGDSVSVAFVDTTLFVMSDSPVTDVAKLPETKAAATTLTDGDDIRIGPIHWYKVRVFGERVSDPIKFVRTWPKKTAAEVEAHKRSWLHDQEWGLGGDEGFEHHYSDLVAFQKETESKQEAARVHAHEVRVAALDVKAGLKGNRPLAEYIIGLEDTIDFLEEKIGRLSERIDENMDRVRSVVDIPRRRYA